MKKETKSKAEKYLQGHYKKSSKVKTVGYHDAGLFDKKQAKLLAKKHKGVAVEDSSGEWLVIINQEKEQYLSGEIVQTAPVDLFEKYDELPKNVKKVLDKYSDDSMTYKKCKTLVTKLKAVGYICEYGLDAVPYDLKKIELNKVIFKEENTVPGEKWSEKLTTPEEIGFAVSIVNRTNIKNKISFEELNTIPKEEFISMVENKSPSLSEVGKHLAETVLAKLK